MIGLIFVLAVVYSSSVTDSGLPNRPSQSQTIIVYPIQDIQCVSLGINCWSWEASSDLIYGYCVP